MLNFQIPPFSFSQKWIKVLSLLFDCPNKLGLEIAHIYYCIFVNSASCTGRLKVKRKVLTSNGSFADLDMSIAYWNIVLEGRFKFLDIWCEFLLVSKVENRDLSFNIGGQQVLFIRGFCVMVYTYSAKFGNLYIYIYIFFFFGGGGGGWGGTEGTLPSLLKFNNGSGQTSRAVIKGRKL